MPPPPRLVLDTNVLIGGAFRPDSASGRLAEAVREGRLANVWCATTRDEAERLLAQIPPLRSVAVAPLFPEAGRTVAPLAPNAFEAVPGALDRVFAALADAAAVPLVTADGPLASGARAHGVVVLSPSDASRAVLG